MPNEIDRGNARSHTCVKIATRDLMLQAQARLSVRIGEMSCSRRRLSQSACAFGIDLLHSARAQANASACRAECVTKCVCACVCTCQSRRVACNMGARSRATGKWQCCTWAEVCASARLQSAIVMCLEWVLGCTLPVKMSGLH